jgi:hypothetical protein
MYVFDVLQRIIKKKPLRHDKAMIQPSFTSSKWNMGEIFGLKFHLTYLRNPQGFFLEIPPCGKKVIFVSEFLTLLKRPHFYEI